MQTKKNRDLEYFSQFSRCSSVKQQSFPLGAVTCSTSVHLHCFVRKVSSRKTTSWVSLWPTAWEKLWWPPAAFQTAPFTLHGCLCIGRRIPGCTQCGQPEVREQFHGVLCERSCMSLKKKKRKALTGSIPDRKKLLDKVVAKYKQTFKKC